MTTAVQKDAPYDGSQPMRDRRREAFARALFEGVEVCAAYEQSGFKRPRGNAQRAEREPEVQARINYLRRELDAADLAQRTVRRQQLRDQLKAVTDVDRVDMFEEVTFTKKVGRGRNAREISLRRLQLKPLSQLTTAQRGLVEGLEADGMRPIMPSKLTAMALRAKLDGLDAPTKIAATDPSGENQAAIGPTIFMTGKSLDQMNDEELVQEIQRLERHVAAEEAKRASGAGSTS